MQLGLSIGLFFLFSVLLVLLYCLALFIRHKYAHGDSLENPQPSAQQSQLDLTTVALQTISNRSKISRKEGGPVLDLVNAVLAEQMPETINNQAVTVTVYLAYRLDSGIRVLQTQLISFQRKVRIFQSNSCKLNFKKRIEQNTVDMDDPQAAQLRERLMQRVGVRKQVTYLAPEECKLDVEYPMQMMKALREEWSVVNSVEEARLIQQQDF